MIIKPADLRISFDTKYSQLTDEQKKISFCLDTKDVIMQVYDRHEDKDAADLYAYISDRQAHATLDRYAKTWNLAI